MPPPPPGLPWGGCGGGEPLGGSAGGVCGGGEEFFSSRTSFSARSGGRFKESVEWRLSGLRDRGRGRGGAGGLGRSVIGGRSPCAEGGGATDVKTESASKRRSTDAFIPRRPVRWNDAILRDMALRSPADPARPAPPRPAPPRPNGRPSSAGFSDLDMISAALGRPHGTAECGNVRGLKGVTRRCSVQEASRAGLSRRARSTLRVCCSNGHANVSPGML